MSSGLSDECIKTALKFLYEQSLAKAGFQADIVITKKTENEKEKVP